MRTLELLPDADLDAAVRTAWRRLADGGLPSLAHHRHPTNRPHLTLAEADALDADARRHAGAVIAAELPLPVRAGSLGMFVHRGVVLHLALVPDPALVELHERVLALLDERGCRPAARSRPGTWVPHLTLATRLPRESVPEALALVGDALPVSGRFVGARSYDTEGRTVTHL